MARANQRYIGEAPEAQKRYLWKLDFGRYDDEPKSYKTRKGAVDAAQKALSVHKKFANRYARSRVQAIETAIEEIGTWPDGEGTCQVQVDDHLGGTVVEIHIERVRR